jgi:predicted aldo/keto reductase-like oxidoreductase
LCEFYAIPLELGNGKQYSNFKVRFQLSRGGGHRRTGNQHTPHKTQGQKQERQTASCFVEGRKPMEYNELGKTGLTVSRFGFGCMRFPPEDAEAIKMVRYAIDHGVKYLDTAYVYKDSEAITGKALRDNYRSKVVLATKSPIWHIKKHADFERYLDEELVRLGTDYIDVYLLHNLNPQNWETVKRYDGLSFLDKMVKKGKIRHKGFSIHSTFPAFKEIIDSFGWEMAQIQMNIMDEHQQVTVEGLSYAAAKGVPIVVMEPLRGGSLVARPPQEILDLIDRFPVKRSLAEWCFRWLYDRPEVKVILSGVSTMGQLKDNLAIFQDSAPNVMSQEERDLIRAMQRVFEDRKVIPCTDCQYCQPCPQGVNIPKVFSMFNRHQLTKPQLAQRIAYRCEMIYDKSSADLCVTCGQCEEKCPQKLPIMELLKTAHAELLET